MAHVTQLRRDGATIRLVDTCGRQVIGRSEEQARVADEWGLAVELKVIFTLENIVENAETAADAGFAAAGRVPGESEAGREVFLVRKVGTLGDAGIAGKYQPQRSVYKPL